MPKRLTGTEKWEDPWFYRLSIEYKCLWLYLLDKCDHAGIWKVNLDLASFHLKVDFKVDETIRSFGDKVVVVNEDNWFIPNFIYFQYGKLNKDNKVHRSVISNLGKLHLLNDEFEIDTSSYLAPHIAPCYQAKDKDKEKDKDKVNIQDKDKEPPISGNEELPEPTLEDKMEEFVELWNFAFKGTRVPQVKHLSGKRKELFKIALKEIGSKQDWIDAILGLRSSEFHLGENTNNWVADVDYFLGKTKKVYLSFSEKYKSSKNLGSTENENHENPTIGENGNG